MSLNFEQINGIVAELATLPFYRSEEAAHLAVVRIVGQMATNIDQVRWLVNRMTSGLYSEWPGPKELRACFCSKFKPADGIECGSSVYPDGIPSERASQEWISAPAPKLLEAAPPKLLEAAKDEPITDPKIQKAVSDAARKMKAMPAGKPIGDERERRFREAITAPQDRPERPAPSEPMSLDRRLELQSQIDRAVADLRARRSAETETERCGAD